MEDYNKYAVKCFKDEVEAVLDLISQLTDDFSKAVDLVPHSKGRFPKLFIVNVIVEIGYRYRTKDI